MKKHLRVAAVVCAIFITGFPGTNAQTEPVEDIGDSSVICECNNNKLCVASGGGTKCWNTKRCWNGDSKC